MRKSVFALVLSAVVAFSANVTGKWTGSFIDTTEGQTKNETACMILNQDGSKITGTVGPTVEEQIPIKAGTIDGNKVTFQVAADQQVIIFELTVDGNRMTGEAHAEADGQKKTARIDVKRAQ